jgi:Tfp pilus assembly protein PilV
VTRLWLALPPRLRAVLIAIAALAVGALALVRYGRRAERVASAEASARAQAKAERQDLEGALDAGDDAASQDLVGRMNRRPPR